LSPQAKQPEPDRSTCTPCRGSGHLISNLGGEPHEVVCPWCGGTGRFQPGRDAQQSPAEHGATPDAQQSPAERGA
jgi:DnaJ-class molecular chaperone